MVVSLRSLVVLWFGLVGSARALSSPMTMSDAKPVLVVGATGRVGRRVVQQLMAQNRPVRAIVRNPDKARELFGTSTSFVHPPFQVHVADLGHYDRDETILDEAMKGVDTVLSVSGVVRFSKWTDFLPWRLFDQAPQQWADRSHPYYGNYLAQKKLLELAEKHNVRRFVRLTGLGLAHPPYHPFSVLFNTILSFSNRWGLLCEQAMFDSPVPTIVLRPGGLAEDARQTNTTHLQIDASGKLPYPCRVGRADVAALAVAAGDLQNGQSYTLAARWCGPDVKPRPQGVKEDGYGTAGECMDHLVQSKAISPRPPKMKMYGIFVGMTVYALAAVGLRLGLALTRLVLRLLRG